jgi:hypothetical protein
MAASGSPLAAGAGGGILKIPRVHVVDSVVPLSGQTTPLLTIQADADFEWWWLSISRTNALLKMLFGEGGTSRKFIFPAVPPQTGVFTGILVDNMAGLVANNGAFPIAVPYVMPGGRQYDFQFTDSSGAQNTVQLAFHGFALFPVPAGS